MAIVKPFSALRYNYEKAGSAETLYCPPYDIIPDAKNWLSRSPRNMIRLEGGERLGTANPYGDAAALLAEWLDDGIVYQEETEAFYLYDMEFTDINGARQSLWGFMARVELRPWADGIVRPHEHTLSAAKEDRRRLMEATGCHFSPVYALHRDPGHAITKLGDSQRTAPPHCDFQTDDGLRHRLWRLDDPDFCEALSKQYAPLSLYIADGHHRYETSLRLRQDHGDKISPYVMMFLCPSDCEGLEVHATHRLLHGLQNYQEDSLRKALSGEFTLIPDRLPANGEPVWLTKNGSWRLVPKNGAHNGLDVALLHDRILEPLLGIDAQNMASGTNLRYTRDPGEALALVESGEADCGFLLSPTRIDQILDTADAGGFMPQKSTYFYPKLITGLLIHRFREAHL